MIRVTKANGDNEPFSEEKLLHSIARAGIKPETYPKVIAHIKNKLYDSIPTAEIYKHILEFLEQSDVPFAKGRYNLKQAIMDLGPTGYPFEDYIGKLFTLLGYKTQTRTILLGTCISHEIDVIAEKKTIPSKKILIEAKFHNQTGIRTNVHVPMYTKARFDDVKEKYHFTEVFLVTNTKATTDAILYAKCVGMHIMSWSYPEGYSLKDFVETYHLYPVTALTTLSRNNKQKLLENNIVLCKDLLENQNAITMLSLDKKTQEQVLNEVQFICKQIN
jgi:hypothetical protein